MGAKLVENITDLLLEVIGYITPVVYSILLLLLLLADPGWLDVSEIIKNEFLLFISLYAVGYLLRSLSLFISGIKYFDIRTEIVGVLSEISTFKTVKKYIVKEMDIKEDLSFNEVRNITIGKHPEISNKVYLFMFRSGLFFDLFVVNSLIIITFIVDWLFIGHLFTINLISSIFCLILFSMSWPLLNARKRFFEISYKIPISNYLSNKLK